MIDLDFRANLGYHIKKFLLHPPFWTLPTNLMASQLAWRCVKFSANNRNHIPLSSGIYCFVLKPKYKYFFETRYLFYVGRTNRTLRSRFGEYLSEQSGAGKPRMKLYEMLNVYKDYLYFYYAEINTTTLVNGCEIKILNTFVPSVNSSIPNARIKPELRNIYEL